jgi:excinuclease UvrABC nuclease subunit
MPIAGDKYPFTWENIDKAPEQAGVYALYDGNEIIYYGRAQGDSVTIRSRLADHKSGREGSCTKNASHYRREVTSRPVSREKELLEEYKKQHNDKLPRCNERVG